MTILQNNATRLLFVLLLVGNFFTNSVADERDTETENLAPFQPEFKHRLIVKFSDAICARSVDGTLNSTSDVVDQFAKKVADDHSAKFEQLIRLDQNSLSAMEELAASKSGRPQPDLASIQVVVAANKELQAIAGKLNSAEFVEWVQFQMVAPEPPFIVQDCVDIAPTTPDFEEFQGYRGPNPGLNADLFWELENARGAGVKLADCEYWFNGSHEDICSVTSELGQTPNPQVIANNWHQHGTASLGASIGGDNNFGILGLAPDVEPFFFPEWTVEEGFRRATAIANAVSSVDPGDIVLLEMQISIGFGFGPAELDLAVWTIVRMASDAGIIVVAAAGNGDQDLDSAAYSEYMSRGDSGAILVGAGSANTAHNKLGFSTYGSRVDVQGWGEDVFTAGYGSFVEVGGDENQNYTNSFSGTSSASALLAGVCASLQSYAVGEVGRRLSPHEMRQALRETGWPQGNGGNIGNFPNMMAASQYIVDSFDQLGDINCDGAVNLLDVQPFVEVLSSGSFLGKADFDGDGSVTLLDVDPFIEAISGG